MKAAQAKESLHVTGPMQQSTVDMSLMKGERQGFIFEKHRSDYETRAHGQV